MRYDERIRTTVARKAPPFPMGLKTALALEVIVESLNGGRNRFGALEDCRPGYGMADLARDLNLPLPHGGYDAIDKAVMILQCLLGDKPTSIMDDPGRMT